MKEMLSYAHENESMILRKKWDIHRITRRAIHAGVAITLPVGVGAAANRLGNTPEAQGVKPSVATTKHVDMWPPRAIVSDKTAETADTFTTVTTQPVDVSNNTNKPAEGDAAKNSSETSKQSPPPTEARIPGNIDLLYDERAGFWPRENSVRIVSELAEAAKYWNEAAGWELFVVDNKNPQITLRSAIDTDGSDVCSIATPEPTDGCAKAYASEPLQNGIANSPYIKCEVLIQPRRWPLLSSKLKSAKITHELGHCLGLKHGGEEYGSAMREHVGDNGLNIVYDREALKNAGYTNAAA